MARCIKCGVELTDKNWKLSSKKEHIYICIICSKQYQKQYRGIHRTKKMEYYKKYYRVHQEKMKQQHKQYREAHKQEAKEYHRQYFKNMSKAQKKKKKQYDRQYKRLKAYGITIEQEIEMLEDQRSKCAICGKFLTDLTNAYVDHDHKTGKVRGILCHHCNTMLGYAKDNPKTLIRAAIYLRNKGVYNGNTK